VLFNQQITTLMLNDRRHGGAGFPSVVHEAKNVEI
jgi:hypothetical protein